MRKDDFGRSQRRWSKRRNIFADRRRRRFPWKVLAGALALIAAVLVLAQVDLDALLAPLSRLLPDAAEAPAPPPQRHPGSDPDPSPDPNRLALPPLPPSTRP